MQELRPYFDLLLKFRPGNPVALDHAHNLMLVGALVARKPQRILELGVGSGFVTASLLAGIQFNRRGRLTSVDNWMDTNGREPDFVKAMRTQGVQFVSSSEEAFVRRAETDAHDFLVSDADHLRSGGWVDQHLRIVANDGFLFFHDTNDPAFPSLATIEGQIRERGLAHFHFKTNSRPDERCQRGFLFVINRK